MSASPFVERTRNIALREFSSAEVEGVLASLFDVANTKRAAFRSRMKAIQKYGVPSMKRQGRGVAATFTADHLMQLALALELTNAGLAPQAAARVLRVSWWNQRPFIVDALEKVNEFGSIDQLIESIKNRSSGLDLSLGWVWQVYTENFQDLMDAKYHSPQNDWLKAVTIADLWTMTAAGNSLYDVASLSRAVLINSSTFIMRFAIRVMIETDAQIGEIIKEYKEAEPGIDIIKSLVIDFMEAQVKGAIEEKNNLDQFQDWRESHRRKAISLLSDELDRTTKVRLMEHILSDDAFYELSWMVTPPNDRQYAPPQTGEVLERRKSGQAELAKYGFIEELSGDAFYEPELTEFGIQYLSRHSSRFMDI